MHSVLLDKCFIRNMISPRFEGIFCVISIDLNTLRGFQDRLGGGAPVINCPSLLDRNRIWAKTLLQEVTDRRDGAEKHKQWIYCFTCPHLFFHSGRCLTYRQITIFFLYC